MELNKINKNKLVKKIIEWNKITFFLARNISKRTKRNFINFIWKLNYKRTWWNKTFILFRGYNFYIPNFSSFYPNFKVNKNVTLRKRGNISLEFFFILLYIFKLSKKKIPHFLSTPSYFSYYLSFKYTIKC